MSYQSIEESLEQGAPFELYEFTQGIKRWLFVSSASEMVVDGQLYKPAAIKRDRIRQTDNTLKDQLKFAFPRDSEFAQQFVGFVPEEVVGVTVRRGHYGDSDGQLLTYWKGRVMGASASGAIVTVACESIYTSMRRPGLRARFERSCRHVLYGGQCQVVREDYKHEGRVLGVEDGLRITVSGAALKPDGWYQLGILAAADGVMRFITKHQSDTVTLNRPMEGLVGNTTVVIYPGCDHHRQTCANKFNNLDNFGGFPYIPARNPFDGSSII